MKDANNQSLMSLLQPPATVDGLTRFLSAAEVATGCRTDADLARLMGVPISALANWKRRGRVSQKGLDWFRTSLIPAVANVSPNVPLPNDAGANAALIELIAETGGNPIMAHTNPRVANAFALGGLIALSRLVVDLMLLHGLGGSHDDPSILAMLKEAVRTFRSAPALQGFTA